MYYDHSGRTIVAGMEVIARINQDDIETLGSDANDVKATIKLAD